MSDDLAPAPVATPPADVAVADEVKKAQSSISKAAELARSAADQATELPAEVLNLLEAGLESVKDEIARLRHTIHTNAMRARQPQDSGQPPTEQNGGTDES